MTARVDVPHICIGAPLARLELRLVIDEPLERTPGFELDGDAVPTTGLKSGYDRLPLRFACKTVSDTSPRASFPQLSRGVRHRFQPTNILQMTSSVYERLPQIEGVRYLRGAPISGR